MVKDKLLNLKQDPLSDSIYLLSIQIRSIVVFSKFKEVSGASDSEITETYTRLMSRYLQALSDPHKLFPLLQAPESVIQKGLVVEFLPVEYNGR